MKIKVGKKTKKNIVSGIINRIITILLAFLLRMLLIRKIGLDFTGAKSLFNSILQILSIIELGFFEAVTFALYRPVAEDDYDKINEYLSFLRYYYILISIAIFAIGLCLTPFLPSIVNVDDYRSYNYVWIFILILINYVFSYCFGAYKKAILTAYLHVNIINNISSYLTVLLNISEILILLCTKNIYLYLSVSIVFTVINNILIDHYADKIYVHYQKSDRSGFADVFRNIRNNVIGLSVRKICEIARHSLDNILVFSFLTLSSIAIFNNYLFISDSVSSFLYLITSSLIAGIGNRIQTSSADENLKEMRMINCAYMSISSWTSAFLICLYQPFMILWMGEEYILDISSVILIVVLFYIQKSGGIQSVYTEANGLYWENRNRYLYEALLHLLLGLVLTVFFGINGVLAAAVISLFVFGGIFSPLILFRNYYHTSSRIYFLDLLKQSAVTMICCLAVYFLGGLYHGSLWMTLLVRFTVCLFCFPVLYMLLYSRDELFRVTVKWCIGLIKN